MEMVQHKAPVKQMSSVMPTALVQYAPVRKEVMRVLWLIRILDALLTFRNVHQENAFALELQLTQMQQAIIQPRELVPVAQLNVSLMEHVKVNII